MAPPMSVSVAIRQAQTAIKGDFLLHSGEFRGNPSEEEKTYIQVFNSKLQVLSKPLVFQINSLSVTLFKAGFISPDNLRREPRLTIW